MLFKANASASLSVSLKNFWYKSQDLVYFIYFFVTSWIEFSKKKKKIILLFHMDFSFQWGHLNFSHDFLYFHLFFLYLFNNWYLMSCNIWTKAIMLWQCKFWIVDKIQYKGRKLVRWKYILIFSKSEVMLLIVLPEKIKDFKVM